MRIVRLANYVGPRSAACEPRCANSVPATWRPDTILC